MGPIQTTYRAQELARQPVDQVQGPLTREQMAPQNNTHRQLRHLDLLREAVGNVGDAPLEATWHIKIGEVWLPIIVNLNDVLVSLARYDPAPNFEEPNFDPNQPVASRSDGDNGSSGERAPIEENESFEEE
jgi:hypothetical protein